MLFIYGFKNLKYINPGMSDMILFVPCVAAILAFLPMYYALKLHLSLSPAAVQYDALHNLALSVRASTSPGDPLSFIESLSERQSVTRCEWEVILSSQCRITAKESLASSGISKANEKYTLSQRLSLDAYEFAVTADFNDIEGTLERWRRVVAMRQNRVLVPGRTAQIYSQLISVFLRADEFDFLRQVLQYVGLTPDIYLPRGQLFDLEKLSCQVAKVMLDIDLEQWQWEEHGRALGAPEPLSPREKGENIAEWLWKQVPPVGGRFELEFMVRDMILSLLRVGFREARQRGLSSVVIKLPLPSKPSSPYFQIHIPRSSLELLRDFDAVSIGLDVNLK
jgi:hypothetical protein